MDLSVVIPTHGRPEKLSHCLAALAEQETSADWELIIGVDGPADETPDPVIPAPLTARTRVIRYPRSGLISIRSRTLDEASGRTVLWMNDDAYANPGLIESHAAAHRDGGLVVGAGKAEWKPIDSPTLFDRIATSTDLIFFQKHSAGSTPGTIGYRDCFGINMSFPVEAAKEAGGLPVLDRVYGYEDIELAYRLREHGASIVEVPGTVTHDHRYSASAVMRREYSLGRAAAAFAELNPAFTRDLFGRDVLAESYLDYIRSSLGAERRDAERIERTMLSFEAMPADAASDDLLPALAEHWIPLKRYLWRWGLLDASIGQPERWSRLAEAPSLP